MISVLLLVRVGLAFGVGCVPGILVLGVAFACGVGFVRGVPGVSRSMLGAGLGSTFEFSFVEFEFVTSVFELSSELVFVTDSSVGSGDGENSGVASGEGVGPADAPA